MPVILLERKGGNLILKPKFKFWVNSVYSFALTGYVTRESFSKLSLQICLICYTTILNSYKQTVYTIIKFTAPETRT